MVNSRNGRKKTRRLAAVATLLVATAAGQQLLESPHAWIAKLKQMAAKLPRSSGRRLPQPQNAYLNLLAGALSSSALVCDAAENDHAACLQQYQDGTGWFPAYGVTMAGHRRMQNIKHMLLKAEALTVTGSYVECGVWRGGMSIFAAAVLETFRMARQVYLCDSFQGLPRPRRGSVRSDETLYVSRKWNASLSQAESAVIENFHTYGVPTTNVHMVRGYFVDSLPGMRATFLRKGETIAVLRLDGDMYDSTIDILYNLYDLVPINGLVVIDDFGWTHGITDGSKATWGAKDAILDFRAVHGIEDDGHTFHNIDGFGAWFQKRRQIELQRDKYQESVRIGNYRRLQPTPKLNSTDYARLMSIYDTRASLHII